LYEIDKAGNVMLALMRVDDGHDPGDLLLEDHIVQCGIAEAKLIKVLEEGEEEVVAYTATCDKEWYQAADAKATLRQTSKDISRSAARQPTQGPPSPFGLRQLLGGGEALV
jgi:hypothetical protein